MNLSLRFTKFKYVFWSFTKKVNCQLNDTTKELHTEGGQNYTYKEMNIFAFFFCKYLPILLFLGILFNKYDFYFSQNKLLSYIFGAVATIFVFSSEELKRQILLGITFGFAVVASFYLGDMTLIGYGIKYFVLFSILVMFYLDFMYKPYELYDQDGKLYTHFLIRKQDLNIDTKE